MDLQELKQKLSEAGFSEGVAKKIDEILVGAIAKGGLSPEEKNRMMELIDLDIEAGNLEADAMEQMAVMLDSYAHEADSVIKSGEEKEDIALDEAGKEASALESEMEQLKVKDQFASATTPVPQWNQPVTQATPVQPAPFPGNQVGQ